MTARQTKILELARDGLSRAEIHKQVGGSICGVSVTLTKFRNEGLIGKKQVSNPQVTISPNIFALIACEAKDRKMKPHDLVRAIIAAVVEDDLFKAVLDK